MSHHVLINGRLYVPVTESNPELLRIAAALVGVHMGTTNVEDPDLPNLMKQLAVEVVEYESDQGMTTVENFVAEMFGGDYEAS